MATSDTGICNLALQKVGAKSITSLGDDTVAARECNRLYAHCRDMELRANPWGFAKKRAQLAAHSTAPSFGPARAFPLPDDYLRLHRDIYDLAASDGLVPNDWSLENHEGVRAIVTDEEAPLPIVYIASITDVTLMDPLFKEALAARIALNFTEKLTQSNSKRQLAAQEYKDAISQARKTKAIETKPQQAEEDPWLIARR